MTATELPSPRHIVVMGASGSGKSSVAARLAAELGYTFAEGDEFHPPSNLAKLTAQQPLSDADRAPWLAAIAAWMNARDANGDSSVVACSALKRRYRDVLRAAARNVCFVQLTVPPSVLAARLRRRAHFMPPELLQSQLDDLEPLQPDEPGHTLDGTRPLDTIVTGLVERLGPGTAG